jgi:hypothetical protein
MFSWIIIFTKWEKSEEIKRELVPQGKVPVLMDSPGVWEHPRGLMPWGAPPLGEHIHMRTSLTTK